MSHAFAVLTKAGRAAPLAMLFVLAACGNQNPSADERVVAAEAAAKRAEDAAAKAEAALAKLEKKPTEAPTMIDGGPQLMPETPTPAPSEQVSDQDRQAEAPVQ